MQFGSPRDIVIPMKIPAGETPYLEAVISFERNGRTHNVSLTGATRLCNEDSMISYFRSMAITRAFERYNRVKDCAAF